MRKNKPETGETKKPTTAKRHPVTCYLPDDTHEGLRLGAQMAGQSMTAIMEKVMAEWVGKNRKVLDQAKEFLSERKLSSL